MILLRAQQFLILAFVSTVLACSGGKSERKKPIPKTTERGTENPVAPDSLNTRSCSKTDEAIVKAALEKMKGVELARTAAQKKPTLENILSWLHASEKSAGSLGETLRKNALNCISSQIAATSGNSTAGAALHTSLATLNEDVTYLRESYRGQL